MTENPVRAGARAKRQQLVETAARLAYERGFGKTSLADIASASGVPLGNVYFYFKTKDSLGEALVDRLAEQFATMRSGWEKLPHAKRRIAAFIQMTADNREALSRSGCPVGTLCAELHKGGGPVADRAAAIFAQSIDWLAEQFRQLGKRSEARDLAVHVLSVLEGASLLTHSFHDPSLVAREAKRLERWLHTL